MQEEEAPRKQVDFAHYEGNDESDVMDLSAT